jgi:hypothetical protein
MTFIRFTSTRTDEEPRFHRGCVPRETFRTSPSMTGR